MISATRQIGKNAGLQIVSQREYQENCNKLIEANAGLQDAINSSENSRSVRRSSYKLDESISRLRDYYAPRTTGK